MRTTMAQTRLRISAVWSTPLLFALEKVPKLKLPQISISYLVIAAEQISLTLLHVYNKGTDQTARMRSLISSIVIRSRESTLAFKSQYGNVKYPT